MDIYRILENFNAASRDSLTEGPVGAIAGGLAGAALTRSPGGAMAGASMGDSLTDEARDPNEWNNQLDAQGIAQQKARIARERNRLAMTLKMQNPGQPYNQVGAPAAPAAPAKELDEALHHICETHRAACEHFVKGGDLDSELFDALHNHYLSRGEMPFGIAKMRDGHPKDWCAQKLAEHLGLEECGTSMSMGEGDYAPMAESTNSIRRLAGLEESADDVEEGNDFTQARKDAIAAGKTSFKCGGKTYKVTGDTSDEKKQVKEGAREKTLAEARNTYTVAFVDPENPNSPEQIGTFNNAVAAKKLIRDSFNDNHDTGDRLVNVAPGIYVIEEDYRNTGERATADNYKYMYHWIIQKSQSVAEGSKPDFLDIDDDGNKKEPMKKAVADKKAGPQKGVNPFAKKDKKVDEAKEDKPAFPGSPEYEKKYGKVKHDDDSAFHKTKVSTGTVYSRKHKEEPEADDEDDTPKKKGRPTGTKKKIGAKGPSTTSKLIKDGPKKAPSKAKKKVKEGMDIEEATADQFAIYSPKAIEIGQRFCDQYGIDDPDEMQLVIELIDGQIDLAQSTNTPLDMNKIKSEVGKYFRMAYRGLRDPMPNFRKKFNEDDVEMKDQGEYDQEGDMVKDNIHTIRRAIDELENCISDNDNMPEWVEEKISQAKGMIQAASEYIQTQQERGSEEETGEEGIEMDEAAPVAGNFKPGDKVTWKYPSGRQVRGVFKGMKDGVDALIYSHPNTYAIPLSNLQLDQGSEVEEAGYSAKAARAGKDIGKPGKNFAKIAKSSGGGEKGQRIAGAVLNKLRHPKESEGQLDELSPKTLGSYVKKAASDVNTKSRDAQQHKDMWAGDYPVRGAKNQARQNQADIDKRVGGIGRAVDRMSKQGQVKETGMGGTVAGGMAPAPGQKTFAEASSGSHEAGWKAAGKAVHAIMKKRGYAGSKTEQGYMWTKQTPKGTAFVDVDFDERQPDWAHWGEGELKGAKNKSYYQSGNDHISDLAQVIGELFANVKLGKSSMDEADKDGKPNFAKKDGKHKPDDDGDGVPDWADKKPGKDDNEESDDSDKSEESEEDDDKALKKMKSHAGIEDKDDSDDEESDDKPEKGKKPDFGKKKDDDSDDSDDEDDSEEKSEKKDSGDSEEKSKDKSGTPYGKSVYESAFKKSLKTQLRESVNMNTSQDDTGKKSVTVTATDEDADKLGELLKMAGLFSSQGYSSVCQGCGGVHEAGACGHNNDLYGEVEVAVAEDLANSPDEHYSDEDTMLNTLSGGLNGRKSTGQSTGPVVNRQDSRQGIMGEAQKVQEEAKNRLWKLYGDMSSK